MRLLDEKERDGFSEPLSAEERAGIVAEWFRGLAFIQFGFSVKFGFCLNNKTCLVCLLGWRILVWSVLGIGLRDVAKSSTLFP